MILMLQSFDGIANENAWYKCNESEWIFYVNWLCIIDAFEVGSKVCKLELKTQEPQQQNTCYFSQTVLQVHMLTDR